MTGTSLGVAVVGYGWMGRLHAQAYLRLPHHYPELPAARLIGVADPEAERLEAMTRSAQTGRWTRAARADEQRRGL